jgi:hypothetical protein
MYYNIILTYLSSVSFSGVCVLRPRHSIRRVRDDMLWCGQRNMLAAVRHHNEVHRKTTTDGAGLRCPFDTHMDPDRVAASSQQSQTVLHYIGTVGRW